MTRVWPPMWSSMCQAAMHLGLAEEAATLRLDSAACENFRSMSADRRVLSVAVHELHHEDGLDSAATKQALGRYTTLIVRLVSDRDERDALLSAWASFDAALAHRSGRAPSWCRTCQGHPPRIVTALIDHVATT